jgi:hypothetical protein
MKHELWMDEEELGVKSRKIVNPLAKEMGMGRLPVFERLNRGEMA